MQWVCGSSINLGPHQRTSVSQKQCKYFYVIKKGDETPDILHWLDYMSQPQLVFWVHFLFVNLCKRRYTLWLWQRITVDRNKPEKHIIKSDLWDISWKMLSVWDVFTNDGLLYCRTLFTRSSLMSLSLQPVNIGDLYSLNPCLPSQKYDWNCRV